MSRFISSFGPIKVALSVIKSDRMLLLCFVSNPINYLKVSACRINIQRKKKNLKSLNCFVLSQQLQIRWEFNWLSCCVLTQDTKPPHDNKKTEKVQIRTVTPQIIIIIPCDRLSPLKADPL